MHPANFAVYAAYTVAHTCVNATVAAAVHAAVDYISC